LLFSFLSRNPVDLALFRSEALALFAISCFMHIVIFGSSGAFFFHGSPAAESNRRIVVIPYKFLSNLPRVIANARFVLGWLHDLSAA
jgi:hypothetical protein